MPPQIYELSRMRNIKTEEELRHLVSVRQEHGIERWLPVIRKCTDGVLSLLPGDDFYPKDFDDVMGASVKPVDMTLAESSQNCVNFHRVERNLRTNQSNIIISGKTNHGHYYEAQ